VNVVGYERRVALLPPPSIVEDDADDDAIQVEEERRGQDDGDDGSDASSDEESFLSFDDDDDDAANVEPLSSKRQKPNPSWQTDKNNYQVPFVGTSVSKGAVGSITPNVWPTGFLEVYRNHSPSGVELISNDFISSPDGGMHKMLCKESDGFSLNDGGKSKKNSSGGGSVGQQTRGQIISMTLQSNYWMALSEWILGFVPVNKLKQELHWETEGRLIATITAEKQSDNKCSIPPPIMTILMKERLPEWIDAIHKYTQRQNKVAQARQKERQMLNKKKKQQNGKKKQQNQSMGDDEQMMEKEVQPQLDGQLEKKKERLLQKRQQREETLLLSALQNLIALCHLSNGTAREVLRKVTAPVGNAAAGKSKSTPASGAKGGKFGGNHKAAPAGGESWMVQLFQQQQQQQRQRQSMSTASYKPQMECLRLVCTLLETNDYVTLTRLTEVPAGSNDNKQGGKNNKGGNFSHSSGGQKKNAGLAYIALRYGIQRLLELEKKSNDEAGGRGEDDDKIDLYAQYTTRLLRDVRDIILPDHREDADEGDGGDRKGFVLGIGATAGLLSGEVLNNLTKLSLLAPPLVDAEAESIQAIINGNDGYESNLSPMEVASIEARRLLFLLLADTHRSPFLYGIHHKASNRAVGTTSTNSEEQSTTADVHLSQLSKALHGILANQGHHANSLSMKMFLGMCLKTTPELVPHFFRGLKLVDPKPTYRSLAALTFVEGVLREAPITLPPLSNITSLSPVEQEQLLATIIPSCVTKTLLGKVVQSQSALLVSSGLKLIITLLSRAHDAIFSLSSLMATTATDKSSSDNGTSIKELKRTISQAMMRHLPEVSLLFSIPSRFDPFETATSTTSSRSKAIVVLQLCEAVQCYARLDPPLILANVKFDWAKLVPNEETQDQVQQGRVFSSAEPLLQRHILQTLLVVSSLSESQSPFSPKMLPNVLSILVSTTIPEVYTMARKLALSLMERETTSSQINSHSEGDSSVENDEVMQCHQYESTLWVDGISADNIQELVTMIEEVKQQRVQHKIVISQAWSNASMGYAMPSLGVSSLLSSSICQLLLGLKEGASSLSKKMSLLLIQIATKMLLFQANPKPFAAMIVFCTKETTMGDKQIAALYHVSESILHDDAKTNDHIESLASDVFLPESCLNGIVRMMNAEKKNSECAPQLDDVSRYMNATAMRQCLSMMKYAGGQNNEKLNTLVRKIVISILETGDNVSGVVSRLAALFNTHSLKSADMESTMILLLSAARSNLIDFEVKSLLGCDDTMKAGSVGMAVVSELLRCSVVPANREGKPFIVDVWRYCSSALQSNYDTSGLRDFLLMIMMHTMPDKTDSKVTSPFPLGEMFDLWALMAGKLTDKLALDFCLRLEDYLASLFRMKDGQGTWAVYQRVCSLTPKVFVDLFLNTLQEREESDYDGGATLLQSMLEYDCSGFSCLSNLFGSMEADAKLEKLWDGGHLDLTAATFILQTVKQKGACDIVASAYFAEAAGVIGRRFLDLLRQQTPLKGVTLGVILGVLEALCSNQFILHETQQGIIDILGHLENGTKALAINDEMQMMNLAIRVEPSAKNQGLDTSLLLTKAFLRCCKVLPKHIKKMLRTKQEAETRLVESFVHTLSSFIENAHSFDEKTVTLSANVIDNCIIACLKYGMMESNEVKSCSALGGCLKIIRLLMVKSHSPESPTGVVLGSLNPSQVHAMAVSHSSFQSAVSSGSMAFTTSPLISNDNGSGFCDELTQQLELIRLLLCTLSLDANHVKLEKETWMTILSVYNASTNIVDGLLRRLMFLYERNGNCKDEIMMNDLRWGPMATKHISNVGEDESWEWFVDVLELNRIRSTLSKFPVADTLEPTSYKDVEYITNSDDKIKQDAQFGSDSEDETDDDSIDNVPRLSVAPQENAHDVISSLAFGNNLGDDLRYSPGFILPLILATLEAYLPHEQGVNRNESLEYDKEMSQDEEIVDEDEEKVTQRQAFGNICRRVGDRGGIALAVASLSSRCPSIRKLAVSICGLFLKALQMQESHGMKAWRERPQQEMIMSSIQRCLAVRRSIQIKKYDAQEGVELGGMTAATHKYNIPMLPAVSAVFLAKVLLILSKPGDEMYGHMNKYFLRLTDYHGAFQDCFGLPAFLSLYCSSSDELSRCRTERNWALLALKDGAVDEFCYRIISQHHVPELIMSSFDSLIDNPESKSEVYLTIDVIESLIQSGGKRASDHLIKRQGLLSWLHGIISWRNVSSVFPYDALKIKFLKLVTTAVSSYRCTKCGTGDEVVEAQVFYEKVPLANAVVRIFLDGDDVPGNDGDSSPESSTALLENTCNALWVIYLADKESQLTSTPQGSTTLTDMASMLKKFVCHEEMFSKVLTSMCDLPLVTNENDMPSAKLFCELALGFILEMKTQLVPDTVLLSLKRVHELMKLHPCLRDESNIVRQVIKCRRIAVLIGGIQVWDLFLPYLENSVLVD